MHSSVELSSRCSATARCRCSRSAVVPLMGSHAISCSYLKMTNGGCQLDPQPVRCPRSGTSSWGCLGVHRVARGTARTVCAPHDEPRVEVRLHQRPQQQRLQRPREQQCPHAQVQHGVWAQLERLLHQRAYPQQQHGQRQHLYHSTGSSVGSLEFIWGFSWLRLLLEGGGNAPCLPVHLRGAGKVAEIRGHQRCIL